MRQPVQRRKDAQRSGQIALAIVCMVLAIGLVVVVGFSVAHGMPQSNTAGNSGDNGLPAATHTLGKATPDPGPAQIFQTGICYKAHSGTATYGPYDQAWNAGLPAIKAQTGAKWIEMVVILYQLNVSSTTLYLGPNSPTPENVAHAIEQAHAAGMKIYMEPYVNVAENSNATQISFTDAGDAAAWFNSYWSAYKPYFEVAQQQKVEMAAVGSELYKMEGDQYADDWGQLISQIHSVYTGPLTYNLITEAWTHDGVIGAVPGWMRNPAITYLGVQEYTSLATQREPEPESLIALEWQQKVLPRIDAFAAASGKPLIITEIGYRNATDALFSPAVSVSTAPQDPALQAAAYQAALTATLGDPNIHGIYFFAWDEGVFTPSSAALAVLQSGYSQIHG